LLHPVMTINHPFLRLVFPNPLFQCLGPARAPYFSPLIGPTPNTFPLLFPPSSFPLLLTYPTVSRPLFSLHGACMPPPHLLLSLLPPSLPLSLPHLPHPIHLPYSAPILSPPSPSFYPHPPSILYLPPSLFHLPNPPLTYSPPFSFYPPVSLAPSPR